MSLILFQDATGYAMNFRFLAYGLIAAWLVLMIYGLVLSGRERKLQSQLDQLRLMVQDKEHERR